jgi:hypothetical protein
MRVPEHASFRSVSVTMETLVEWAEHVFRYMFQTHNTNGAFTPSYESEQNILILGVFRCSDERIHNLEIESFSKVPRRPPEIFNT